MKYTIIFALVLLALTSCDDRSTGAIITKDKSDSPDMNVNKFEYNGNHYLAFE